jgi:predicted dehydrogenase
MRTTTACSADPDIDIIDICTPHPFHAKQAIAAAQAGKHLLIEKPICLNWEDARAMRQAIRKAGVQVCVCFECRFSAHFHPRARDGREGHAREMSTTAKRTTCTGSVPGTASSRGT